MLGLMQNWPLTVDRILGHAKDWFGDREVVSRSVARNTLDLGLRHYTRADLETARAAGEHLMQGLALDEFEDQV